MKTIQRIAIISEAGCKKSNLSAGQPCFPCPSFPLWRLHGEEHGPSLLGQNSAGCTKTAITVYSEQKTI